MSALTEKKKKEIESLYLKMKQKAYRKVAIAANKATLAYKTGLKIGEPMVKFLFVMDLVVGATISVARHMMMG